LIPLDGLRIEDPIVSSSCLSQFVCQHFDSFNQAENKNPVIVPAIGFNMTDELEKIPETILK
jgi:hypothetical protein